MLKFKQFKWQEEISFKEVEVIEGKPRVYATPSGNYPSMTSVLSILEEEDNPLEKWRERIGHEEAEKITNDSAHRGNELHDYNEAYLKNELKRSDLKGQARTLFNRVKKYLDEIELVIATEVPLWHKEYNYAGRVDCIGMLNGEVTIIDHKNSRRPININIEWHRQKIFKYMLQLTGYSMAFENMTDIEARYGCLIVGNHLTSTSDRFIFDLQPLRKELKIVVDAYNKYGHEYAKENSVFFDDERLTALINFVSI